MQRIADQVALDGERILHEAGGMEGADGRVTGDAGRHHLAAAGPAGHEMRLDQAGGDAQIGLDEAPVDADRRAACCGRAEIDVVVRRRARNGWRRARSPSPRDRRPVPPVPSPSLGRCRPVATRTVMLVERNAGSDHGLDHRAQEQPVRHRPGDVADQNAGAALAARQVAQRRRARPDGRRRRGSRPAWSGSLGSGRLRMTVGSAPAGRRTGRWPRPKAMSTVAVIVQAPRRPWCPPSAPVAMPCRPPPVGAQRSTTIRAPAAATLELASGRDQIGCDHGIVGADTILTQWFSEFATQP